MIQAYRKENGRLIPVESGAAMTEDIIWIDVVSPSPEEERQLEAQLGTPIPTREDMEEIEISSRLYKENEAIYMTAILPALVDADDPHLEPVSFVLSGQRLITIRYHEPRAFRTFPQRAARVSMGCDSGETALIALLEVVVDRLADILENAGKDIDRISRKIFRKSETEPGKNKDFQSVLEAVGRKGDLTSSIRDSLVTLERLVVFLGQETIQHKTAKTSRERIRILGHDIRSINDYAGFLAAKITFLLDATLGMISIEQNAIIKIFSVAAVIFLPPTLIASIYGMNFEVMPELGLPFGYPMALGMMVVSAILPYVYFKRRGWL